MPRQNVGLRRLGKIGELFRKKSSPTHHMTLKTRRITKENIWEIAWGTLS